MSDTPTPTPEPGDGPEDHDQTVVDGPTADFASAEEFTVDVTAFLPDGVELATDDDAETDSEPAVGSETEGEAAADVNVGTEPEAEAEPEVDTSALERLEGELADVDGALAAIDAGEYERSPLLVELLAEQPPV